MASEITTDATTAPAAAKKSARGGARAGAGRKVRAHVEVVPGIPALDFLKQVYESSSVPLPLRIASAKAVVAATVARPGGADRIGKKLAQQLACEEAHEPGGVFAPGGRYAASRPPQNVVQMMDATKKVQGR